LLRRLFCSTPTETTNDIRMARLEALYELGKVAAGGAIVELGTYHGAGATALWMGTRDGHGCDVYTIDDYADRVGIQGDAYGFADYGEFVANLRVSGALICHF
jgi:hypothetical protein